MPRRGLNRQFRIPAGVSLDALNRALLGDVAEMDATTRRFLDGEEGRAIAALVQARLKRSRREHAR